MNFNGSKQTYQLTSEDFHATKKMAEVTDGNALGKEELSPSQGKRIFRSIKIQYIYICKYI